MMRFANYGLIYFLPISIALVESFFSLGLFFFFIKRGTIFFSRIKEQRPASWYKKIEIFLTSFKPVSNFLNYPIGFYILVGFLSIIVSKYPFLSIKGFFFKLLEGTFLYFIFVECFSEKKQFRTFIYVFFASSVLIVSSGFFQHFTGIDFIRQHVNSNDRITSAFAHPNDFAAYLLVVCAIFFGTSFLGTNRQGSLLIWRWSPIQIVSCISFVLALICLGLTYSRGAWIAFFLSILFLGFVNWRVLPISISVILIFLFVFFPGMTDNRNIVWLTENTLVIIPENIRVKSQMDSPSKSLPPVQKNDLSSEEIGKEKEKTEEIKVQSAFDLIKKFNASGRQILWKDAIDIIRQNPFGTGLNTYSRIAHEHNMFWSGYPHNCYLQLTAEMGFIGFFVFVWIMVTLLKKSFENLRHIQDTFFRPIILGLLAGVLGFLMHSFVDTNFYSVQLSNLMWAVMGMIVAAQKVTLKT